MRVRTAFLRAVSAVMGVLFLVAALFLYNDPDPVAWMGIYAAAAVTSFIGALDRLPRWLPAAVGIVAVVWAGRLLPQMAGHVPLAELVRELEAATPIIQEGRAALGLVVIAIWMGALAFHAARRPRDTMPAT
ncbi:MAG TPA: transmembrane 220 family protein [Gemmatimonadales bacterium]|nr:transmembrane 220 family protein [Gemmatimonadales bacterium]